MLASFTWIDDRNVVETPTGTPSEKKGSSSMSKEIFENLV